MKYRISIILLCAVIALEVIYLFRSGVENRGHAATDVSSSSTVNGQPKEDSGSSAPPPENLPEYDNSLFIWPDQPGFLSMSSTARSRAIIIP